MKDETKASVAIALILLVFVIFICSIAYLIWQESTSPKIELNKSEWGCVKTETRITNVLIGKAIVPQPRQKCVEYKRN